MSDSPQTALAPEPLIAGRYAYERELGVGAQARVVLVRDRAANDAPRALKLVPIEHEERVRCEFALLARIAHPQLARVHELVRLGAGTLALHWPRAALGVVSDFVPGQPADQLAHGMSSSRPRSVQFALRVLDRAARALAAVHTKASCTATSSRSICS